MRSPPPCASASRAGRRRRFPSICVRIRASRTLAAKLGRPRGKASLATHLRKTLALSKIDIALLREASPEGLPQDPQALAARIKAAPLKITGVAGFERAISTAGGVAFEALDAGLMLKARRGIFIAGEMLDFDAPTGGYLLQAAFSTGVAAGKGAARFVGLSTTY